VSVGLEVTGELQGFSAAMTGYVEKFPSTVSGAMKDVAERVLETSNVLVPVRTGFLKSTLGYRQDSPLQVTFFAMAPYAPFVEFGTRRMSARLFLTRSIQQHQAEFPQMVESALAQLRDNFFII
jgi:Bacteriophage HK97-gp10, putative tail-component